METAVNNGMCRCCASEGTFKDVKTKYHWMGEEEVYSEMLKVCFDINLCTSEDGDNGGICEVCITQLRNAANFRKQVQHTEEQFKKRLQDKLYKSNIVKVEMMRDDGTESDNNLSEDYSGAEFEVPVKEESPEETKPKKRATKSSTGRGKKAKLDDGETSTKQRSEELHCQICDHWFTSPFNLKRHLLKSHGLDATTTARRLCEACGKVFFNSEWLAKHLAVGCPTSKARVCVKCNVVFDRASDMYKHMRRMHWSEYRLIKLNCPLCGETLRSHEEHDAHLADKHEVNLDYQELMFDCAEDLTKWKENIENKDNVCFIRRTSASGGHYYHCYPPKYLGKPRVPGRGKVCPSRIEVTHESGVWLVTYQSTHVCNLTNDIRKKDRTQVFCPECGVHLDRYDELNEHLITTHGVDVRTENKQFSSYNGTDLAAPKRRKKKKKSYESATPERIEHRVNLTAILQHSNASPFRDKTMRGFSCLYCCSYFKHIDELRDHTAQQSEKAKLNTMIDYKLSYNPIKVDITNLRCTLCGTDMKDLNELKEHLVGAHNKVIYKNIKDIILPFRLGDGHNFTCVVCSAVHISFKNLYHHMSSHYRNYCCKKCGAGYITIAALRKHGKTHEQGNFPCEYCDKTYSSLSKKRNHEKGVHIGGWLRNKCPHCPEIFVSYYDRSEHLVKVHNEAPVTYPCNACNKVYKKKFELNRHIKHHHLQQRSFLCDMCNAKFFSKRGLVDHMSRHTGGEVHSCDVCGKSFSRARTLKEHMRIHEDENSFQCEVCKRTFLQKSSLKSHVRLHQDDLDIFKEFDDVRHLIDNRDLTLKEIAAENKRKAEAEKNKQFM